MIGLRTAPGQIHELVHFLEEAGPANLPWAPILGAPAYLIWRWARRRGRGI